MRAKICLLGATLLVATTALPARAYVPERTPQRDIEARAYTSLEQPAARGSSSALVILRGGRPLIDVGGGTPMTPASVLKLFTMTSGIVRFGPTHRFATRVLGTGPPTAPTSLTLVGGGDPTLATEAFRRARYLPKPTDEIKRPAFAHPLETIDVLAARIAAAGVRTVAGNLYADESLFDSRRTQDGWLPRYLTGDPETGLLSALTVNEGRLDLKGKVLSRNPALSAGSFLKQALQARGIVVAGDVVLGRAPAGSTEIARVQSPPVAEIVDFTLRYSINFDAETMLKDLGAAFGGAGTTRAGVSVVLDTMRSLGVPTTGMTMTDGSGLSLIDRVTPRTVGALVEHILTADGPGWEAVRAAMPVAGRPGTLEKRLKTGPAAGNLVGKTGSLAHVRTMAGWVTPDDGVPLVYVIMFNGVARPSTLTTVIDLFGTLLARAG
ncbi:MAG: D-alanyl-D-alanine carboxypeptidase/D-alanyl-D-alanine-endopeptidase [Actinomycetota bacterium]|nr:D-alanyl-D-alanine carboxypeptidase/D-alanyl-D-alanine-endopeptidase [Actinomycetota bacterium]